MDAVLNFFFKTKSTVNNASWEEKRVADAYFDEGLSPVSPGLLSYDVSQENEKNLFQMMKFQAAYDHYKKAVELDASNLEAQKGLEQMRMLISESQEALSSRSWVDLLQEAYGYYCKARLDGDLAAIQEARSDALRIFSNCIRFDILSDQDLEFQDWALTVFAKMVKEQTEFSDQKIKDVDTLAAWGRSHLK